MSSHNLAVMFVFLFLSTFVVIDYNVDLYDRAIYQQEVLNDAISSAVDEAMRETALSADGYSVTVNRELATDQFYNALFASLGALDEDSQETVRMYVPVLIFVDEDGAYAQYSEMINNRSTKVWSNKAPFMKRYTIQFGSTPDSIVDYTVNYTLGDTITICVDDRVYSDTWQLLKERYINSTKSEDAVIRKVMEGKAFLTDASFDKVRRVAVTDTIVSYMGFCINNHNRIAKESGQYFTFYLPSSAKSEITNTVDSIGLLCLFQGYPLGSGGRYVYSKFAFGGSKLIHKSGYYTAVGEDGYLYYHKPWCDKITGTPVYFDTRDECARQGAMPCKHCRV